MRADKHPQCATCRLSNPGGAACKLSPWTPSGACPGYEQRPRDRRTNGVRLNLFRWEARR